MKHNIVTLSIALLIAGTIHAKQDNVSPKAGSLKISGKDTQSVTSIVLGSKKTSNIPATVFVPTKKIPSLSQQLLMLQNGADTSGGGSFILDNKNIPVLLDYKVYYENFEDSFDFSDNSNITPKPHAYVLGYQKVNTDFFKKMDIYTILEKQLNAWKKSSPLLTSLILQALDSIDWRLTPHKIMSFYEDDNIIGGVFYSKDKGAWLSIPTWNETGDLSKAGLLVHEALRHIDIKYESKMNEQDIFLLTTKIMLTSPKDQETLDNPSYFKTDSRVVDIFNEASKRENIVQETKNQIQLFLKEDFVTNSPEIKEALEIFLENISSESGYTLIQKLNKIRNNTSKANLAHNLQKIINILFDYVQSECGLSISIRTLDYLNVGNNLEYLNNNIIRVIGESIIAKYIDDNENPYEWYEFSQRAKLSHVVELLKKFQQDLLDSGILISPY